MGLEINTLYRFEEFEIDPANRVFALAGKPIAIPSRAFDLLLYMARNSQRLLPKDELMKAVWGDTIVEESNLTQSVFLLRKALSAQSSTGNKLIVTVPGRGYACGASRTNRHPAGFGRAGDFDQRAGPPARGGAQPASGRREGEASEPLAQPMVHHGRRGWSRRHRGADRFSRRSAPRAEQAHPLATSGDGQRRRKSGGLVRHFAEWQISRLYRQTIDHHTGVAVRRDPFHPPRTRRCSGQAYLVSRCNPADSRRDS